MANQASNRLKYLLATKVIDFLNDSFKIILMDQGFVFSKDSHHLYADVSAQELGTGFGYTQNTKTLSGVSVTENDSDDRTDVVWSNVSWVASGGSIGPTPGAIIFDDDAPNDPIVGYIDFGADYTQVDGGTAVIVAPGVRVK